MVTVQVANVAPVISAINDQTIEEDGTTGPVGFTVADVNADTLSVTASSGNTGLV